MYEDTLLDYVLRLANDSSSTNAGSTGLGPNNDRPGLSSCLRDALNEILDLILGMKVDVASIALKNGEEPLRDDSEESSLEELGGCIEEV